MKKSVIFLAIVFVLMSCDTPDMEKQEPEPEPKPKIYKVTYFGNGHTSGEVPVDDNLYAEGDWFPVLNHGNLKKEGFYFSYWEVKYSDITGTFLEEYPDAPVAAIGVTRQILKFGKQDVEIHAIWQLPQH